MLKRTVGASLAGVLSLSVSNAAAEVYPGYCVELLTHAGYTITTPVTVSAEGTLHIVAEDGDLFIGQYTVGEASWTSLRLLRARAVEAHLAEKESVVYVIGQIDMYSPEPYCGRFRLP